jgi:hypothetical protein
MGKAVWKIMCFSWGGFPQLCKRLQEDSQWLTGFIWFQKLLHTATISKIISVLLKVLKDVDD